MRAISLDEAMTIINGCFAAAKTRRLRPLTAVVLDAGGRLKAALKQDGCAMLRFEVAYGEAGGQLVRDAAGEVIGAIGVTGDAGEMDDVCAIAGIHAAGHKTCSDFNDPEAIRVINVKEAALAPQPTTSAKRSNARR